MDADDIPLISEEEAAKDIYEELRGADQQLSLVKVSHYSLLNVFLTVLVLAMGGCAGAAGVWGS